jgi:hypothetical protein
MKDGSVGSVQYCEEPEQIKNMSMQDNNKFSFPNVVIEKQHKRAREFLTNFRGLK